MGCCSFFPQRKYKYLTGPVWKSCLWSASGFSRHVHMTFVWHFELCSKYVVTCWSRKPPEWLQSAVPNYQETFIAKKKWTDCNPNIRGEKKIDNLIMLTKQLSHERCVHENYFGHHHSFQTKTPKCIKEILWKCFGSSIINTVQSALFIWHIKKKTFPNVSQHNVKIKKIKYYFRNLRMNCR